MSHKNLMKWLRIGCVGYVIYYAFPDLYSHVGDAVWDILSGSVEAISGKVWDSINPFNWIRR